MALDISSLQAPPTAALFETARQAATTSQNQALAAEAQRENRRATASAEADGSGSATPTRLAFSVNSKLDEVVVKVINTDTDKVVREIPPVELQHVSERIREVVGLLFDHRA
jgi:flagellar protein FlaG